MWWYAFANKEHSEVVSEVVAIVCEQIVGLNCISREIGDRSNVGALLLCMFL